MAVKERKTVHSSRCPECGEIPFSEFSDEELRQFIAGTLTFICTNGTAHKSSSGHSWSPTKDEKEAFVKILLSNEDTR